MKTIEEKAKAYDEAIKRGLDYIRHTPATEMVTRQDIFEAIFPELAESEEEKIKKVIKEQLYKIRSTALLIGLKSKVNQMKQKQRYSL